MEYYGLFGQPEGADLPNKEENSDEDTEDGLVLEEGDPEEIEFLPEVNALIQKVRNVVKVFTYSDVNNHVLQQEVTKTEKTELRLKLDMKTRWDTIVGKNVTSFDMIETVFQSP